jgi:hypothetical protein
MPAAQNSKQADRLEICTLRHDRWQRRDAHGHRRLTREGGALTPHRGHAELE